MNHVHISKLDLNLLKAFDALLCTGSVTRAAERLFIGQPAMSHALSRLRRILDDPLFVRTSRGMEPTPEALRIGETVGRILAELDEMLGAGARFDPQQTEHTFTLGMSDYIEAILLPGLLISFQDIAPNVALILRQIGFDDFGEMIDDGDVDLAIGYLPESRPWHRRQTLFSESRRCLYSSRLVGAEPPISLDRYLAHGHVVRALTGSPHTFVDDALQKIGKSRNVALTTPRYTTLPDILCAAPLIATVPTRLAETYTKSSNLSDSALPFDAPDFDVSLVWHRRNDLDPPLVWLREVLDAWALSATTGLARHDSKELKPQR